MSVRRRSAVTRCLLGVALAVGLISRAAERPPSPAAEQIAELRAAIEDLAPRTMTRWNSASAPTWSPISSASGSTSSFNGSSGEAFGKIVTLPRFQTKLGDVALPPVLAPQRAADLPAARPAQPGVSDLFATEALLDPFLIRLQSGTLRSSMRRDLEAYLSDRAALLEELRAALRRAPAGPGRRETLVALASAQEPWLRKLESRAEELRARMRDTDLGERMGGDWYDPLRERRRKKTGQPTPGPGANVVFLQNAAYEDDLSSEQRLWLNEAAARSDPVPVQPGEVVFWFDPSLTRVVLPATAPESLRAAVATYAAEREQRRAEFCAEILRLDAEKDDVRARGLAELTARQAPQLAALAAQADAIREGLRGLPEFSGDPGAIPVSQELQRRMAEYRRKKTAVQAELSRALRGPAEGRPAAPAAGDTLILHWTENPLQMRQLREALTAFEGQNAAALDEIELEGPQAATRERELRGKLRTTLDRVLGDGPSRMRAALNPARAFGEDEATVRARLAEVVQSHEAEFRALEEEAGQLRAATTSDDVRRVPQLLTSWQAHLSRVEAQARALEPQLVLPKSEVVRARELARRREAAAAAQAKFRAELEALEREEAALRHELSPLDPNGDGGGALDRVLDGLLHRMQRAETWEATATYRAAVLEPGLSAAQRRLLLGEAMLEMRRWNVPTKEVRSERR